jgi:uncharacterized protein (DUF1330 family)
VSAYVIADIDVTDPDVYARYRQQVLATVERYGGRFVVRGGAIEPLEGEWRPKRLVILEFPDLERARAWYGSREYAPLIELRQRAARGSVVLVEGAPA